jgi:hypothetical protein
LTLRSGGPGWRTLDPGGDKAAETGGPTAEAEMEAGG